MQSRKRITLTRERKNQIELYLVLNPNDAEVRELYRKALRFNGLTRAQIQFLNSRAGAPEPIETTQPLIAAFWNTKAGAR